MIRCWTVLKATRPRIRRRVFPVGVGAAKVVRRAAVPLIACVAVGPPVMPPPVHAGPPTLSVPPVVASPFGYVARLGVFAGLPTGKDLTFAGAAPGPLPSYARPSPGSAPVPEPTTLALVATGLVALAILRWKGEMSA